MESGKISRSRDQTEWMAALSPSIGHIDDTQSRVLAWMPLVCKKTRGRNERCRWKPVKRWRSEKRV